MFVLNRLKQRNPFKKDCIQKIYVYFVFYKKKI